MLEETKSERVNPKPYKVSPSPPGDHGGKRWLSLASITREATGGRQTRFSPHSAGAAQTNYRGNYRGQFEEQFEGTI